MLKHLALIVAASFIGAAKAQDTITVVPYHIAYPDTHKDTIYVKGYNKVDSGHTAVFIYDPNEGKWSFVDSLTIAP